MIHDGIQKTKKLAEFMKNYTTSVEGYRVIRKEVNFLSSLRHCHLTPLCGVRTNPFMLLIELAPLGSLSTILKQYQRTNKVLTPAVLQASLYQVRCIKIIICTVYGQLNAKQKQPGCKTVRG